MSGFNLLLCAVFLFLFIWLVVAAPSWTRRLRAPKDLKTLIDPNCKKCSGKGYLGTVVTKGPDGKWASTGRQEICGCVGRNYDKYQQIKAKGYRLKVRRLKEEG